MEYSQFTKLLEDGEYEAVLREIQITPKRYERGTNGWHEYGDQPVCDVTCSFEILDGSLAEDTTFLSLDETWPPSPNSGSESQLNRMVQMLEALPNFERPYPRIGASKADRERGIHAPLTSLPVGHRFKVRVVRDCQVGGGRVDEGCQVSDVLGLAESSGVDGSQ